jgi:hypothetical protein
MEETSKINEDELKKREKRREESQNKQIVYALIAMAILIGLVFLINWMIQESRYFQLIGLRFEKIKYGEIPLYHTTLPVTYNGQDAIYNLYLRNDPRLNNVSFNGTIFFRTSGVYISVDPKIGTCEKNNIAIANLVQFISQGLGLTVKGGVSEKNESNQYLPYVTCENTNSTVIMVEKSNSTEVYKTSKDCYIMKVSNCEILEASERFIVSTIAGIKGYDTSTYK